MFPLEPLGDKLIVRQSEAADMTPGGLVLPERAKDKPKEGKVVAIGPGQMLETGEVLPMTVKVGDTVIFASYAGTEVKVEEEPYLILKQEDILAKVSAEG